MKILLSPDERRAFCAQAHGLDPVVMIGDQGLTPAVLKEIERALTAHELIKVRAFTDEREQRSGWFEEICDSLTAAPIQHIGKMLVIWRKSEEKARAAAKKASKPKAPRLTKRQEENKAAGLTRRRVVRKT
jgi:putative YhbY family RNA-binding protein